MEIPYNFISQIDGRLVQIDTKFHDYSMSFTVKAPIQPHYLIEPHSPIEPQRFYSFILIEPQSLIEAAAVLEFEIEPLRL